ncbi:hypothetical protein RHSIM_RhsimUnG0121700 [Rhododendron simsii]|uniref:Methyltransferase n=1 Tax=Rhododendron simsii TaxID=118357 RepID=A0A834L4Y4_RHOSS|nr:hypothetical protein RHSIM_RhsimUnG0121700 [Rhododendron simsii]
MSKPGALDLANSVGGTIAKEEVNNAVEKYEKYHCYYGGDDKERKANYADMVNKYFDLVTSFYEYSWGVSFHFASRWKGESLKEGITRQEHFIALQLCLKPGQKFRLKKKYARLLCYHQSTVVGTVLAAMDERVSPRIEKQSVDSRALCSLVFVSSSEVSSVKLSSNAMPEARQADLSTFQPKENTQLHQFSKSDSGNSSAVHPVRSLGEVNLDYDSIASYSKKSHMQSQVNKLPVTNTVRVAPEFGGYDQILVVKRVDFCQLTSQFGMEKFSFVPSTSHPIHGQARSVSTETLPELNRKAGVDKTCDYVKADFMKMPFPDNSFDVAYALEATCHAPDAVGCYKGIHRVLKPGQCFAAFEWCMTDSFDPNNEEHLNIKKEIELGNGLTDVRTRAQCLEALKQVGFELMPLEYVGLAPKGSQRVQAFLEKAADGLFAGGR